ncbi:hypothetical protein [Pantoea agglomerans]|uniref:hypothetical protein n=1 Tax=Enterobacter agglomerans TaxID=549 RepID=UPI003C7CB9A2
MDGVFKVLSWVIAFFAVLLLIGLIRDDGMIVQDRIEIGKLEGVKNEPSFFYDSTLINLTDGTHIRVSGNVNAWKEGEVVVKATKVKKAHPDSKYRETDICFSNKCYKALK